MKLEMWNNRGYPCVKLLGEKYCKWWLFMYLSKTAQCDQQFCPHHQKKPGNVYFIGPKGQGGLACCSPWVAETRIRMGNWKKQRNWVQPPPPGSPQTPPSLGSPAAGPHPQSTPLSTLVSPLVLWCFMWPPHLGLCPLTYSLQWRPPQPKSCLGLAPESSAQAEPWVSKYKGGSEPTNLPTI